MIYRLSPDLKEVVQQPEYLIPHKEATVIQRFPARGFTEKWLGVDLKDGGNIRFEPCCPKIKCYHSKRHLVAVAIPEDTITAAGLQATLEKGKQVAIPATEETKEYDPYGYFPQCDVEGCDGVSCNGGGCWRETGYWSVCPKHSQEFRDGKPQPKMKDSAILKESKRGEDGILRG